jgi:hypothetical protein
MLPYCYCRIPTRTEEGSTIPTNDLRTSHSCWRQNCLQNLNATLLVANKKVIVCVLRLQVRKTATQSENKSGRSIMLLLVLLLLLYLLFLARTNNFFRSKLQLTASTLFASYRIQKFRALNSVVFTTHTLKIQCNTILMSMWTSLASNFSLQVLRPNFTVHLARLMRAQSFASLVLLYMINLMVSTVKLPSTQWKMFVVHIILDLFHATYESESKHFLPSAVLEWHINLDYFRFWF